MIRNNTMPDNSAFVLMLGIDPQQQTSMDGLHRMIVNPPNASLTELLVPDGILMGQKLADALQLKTNDSVTLLFSPNEGEGSGLEERTTHIAGLFKTGINETDAHIVFCNLSFFNELFPAYGITQIGLNLVNANMESTMIPVLHERFGVSVESWKERYPALLAALTLEKYAMFLVLLLITLVACMNIISLLYMFVTYKKGQIAILQTMGFTATQLIRLFVIMGVLLSFLATTAGILCAALLSLLIQYGKIVPLPNVYYVSHLPAQLDLSIVLSIYIVVFIVSFIASYIPARTITHLKPADVLKRSA